LIWVNQAATGTPYKLYVGNAGTPGGIDILQSSVGNKLRYNTVNGKIDLDLTSGNRLNTDDIIQLGGATNKFFTNELAQDAVGAMFAAGTMSGIQFVYDDIANKMNVTVTATGGGGGGGGIAALVNDPSPRLGGTLNLNNQNINGTGNIDITGNIASSGTLTATTGLGATLSLNGNDITGAGNIDIVGDLVLDGRLSVSSGLNNDLALNGNMITGDGSININGSITALTGLGADLPLNNYRITGTGDINIVGNIDATGIYASGITASGTVSADIVNGGIVSAGTVEISGSQIRSTSLGNSIIFQNTALVVKTDVGIDADSGIDVVGTTNGSNISGTITLSSSRGTTGSPTIVQNGDVLNAIATRGYNGSGYVESSGIITLASGTFSAGALSIPSTIAFFTGDGIHAIGDGTPSMTFNNAGILNVPVMKVGGFTTVTLPASPQAGMIVLDTTTNQFKGYNGSAWVVLG